MIECRAIWLNESFNSYHYKEAWGVKYFGNIYFRAGATCKDAIKFCIDKDLWLSEL